MSVVHDISTIIKVYFSGQLCHRCKTYSILGRTIAEAGSTSLLVNHRPW